MSQLLHSQKQRHFGPQLILGVRPMTIVKAFSVVTACACTVVVGFFAPNANAMCVSSEYDIVRIEVLNCEVKISSGRTSYVLVETESKTLYRIKSRRVETENGLESENATYKVLVALEDGCNQFPNGALKVMESQVPCNLYLIPRYRELRRINMHRTALLKSTVNFTSEEDTTGD